MTVAANLMVNTDRYQYVAFDGTPVKVPATARAITYIGQISTQVSAKLQNLANTVSLDVPVFAQDSRLAHYADIAATVPAVDALALSVKPLVASTAVHAVGVYIERIDQTDNDVYVDVIGATAGLIVFAM